MPLTQFNLNQLKVFSSVYRLRSMTSAAHELHLTQSGVSQHIKLLEEFLDTPLFDRISRTLIPTKSAELLYVESQRIIEGLKTALSQLKGEKNSPSGTVHIGMPVEFGNNIVLPALAEFSQRNPLVSFSVRYGLGPELEPFLLSGELDFAFVDSFRMDRRLRTQPVYDEVLHLCALPCFSKIPIEELSLVDYQESRPVIEMWVKHHLRKPRGKLRIKAWGLDAQGVASLITSGLGAGVLPGHLVAELKKMGISLHLFKGGRSMNTPLVNRISLATLKGRTLSLSSQKALEWLSQSVSKGIRKKDP